MDIRVFAANVERSIKDYLPAELQGMECQIREMRKNNGVVLTALCVRELDGNVGKVIYLEPYMDEAAGGTPMETVMEEIAWFIQQPDKTKDCLKNIDFGSYEAIKDSLSVALINTRSNHRQLRDMPHREIEDLSLVCQIDITLPDEDGIGSVKVNNRMLEIWDVSAEEVLEQAMANSMKKKPPFLKGIQALLEGMVDFPNLADNQIGPGHVLELSGDRGEGMFVLSNKNNLDGAAVLVYPGVTERLDVLFPKGFYIIPSSVDEVLVLSKAKGFSAKELGEILREVNQSQVKPQDRLSDRVYEYDREKGRICQVRESMEQNKEAVR